MNRVLLLIQERTQPSTDWLVKESTHCDKLYPDEESRDRAVCLNRVFQRTVTKMEEDEREMVKELKKKARFYFAL
jgi:hypothetical protein